MNLTSTLFTLIAFTIFKGLILSSTIPGFAGPSANIGFVGDLSLPSCNLITLCLNVVASFIANIVLLIANTIILMAQLLAIFLLIIGTDIPGIPFWLNFLLFGILGFRLLIAIIQMIPAFGRGNED